MKVLSFVRSLHIAIAATTTLLLVLFLPQIIFADSKEVNCSVPNDLDCDGKITIESCTDCYTPIAGGGTVVNVDRVVNEVDLNDNDASTGSISDES